MPPHPGTAGSVWKHFWLSHGRRYYWHLMGGGQGCCLIKQPAEYRTSPHNKNIRPWSSLVAQQVKDPALSRGSGHCSGAGLNPGLGPSPCYGRGNHLCGVRSYWYSVPTSAFPNCLGEVWFSSLIPATWFLRAENLLTFMLWFLRSLWLHWQHVCLTFPFQEILLQAHLCRRLHQVKILMTSVGKTWLARTGARGKLMPALPRTVN